MSNGKASSEYTHQGALLGKSQITFQSHDHNEGEEGQDVEQTSTQASDVGFVKKGADQIAEGEDAETVVAEVQENEEAVAVRQDIAILQHQCEDADGQHQVASTLQEPGEEMAKRVDSHHFHVL